MTQEAEIEKLALYYAYGVDSLGNGMNMPKALEFFRRAFLEDCRFLYSWPDGKCFMDVTGIVAFADSASDFMRKRGYFATQHRVANFLVHIIDDGTARMDSCVMAHHFLPDKSQDIAVARYEDEIVRSDGVWKCRVRNCIQISFDNFAPAYTLS